MDDFVIIQTGEDAKSGVGAKTTRSEEALKLSLAIKTDDSLLADTKLSFLVTLVMDLSGSMHGKGEKSLKEAVRTLKHVATTKLTRHAFDGTAIGFASEARVLAGASSPIPLRDWDEKVTDKISEQIFASGGTNMDDALYVGEQHTKDFSKGHDASVLVLMTDGQPTVGSVFDAETLRSLFVLRREQRREYILPLAMGTCPSADFLKTLTGGETFVGLATELEQVPDALASGLSMFNEALGLFDVEVEVRREGDVVVKTTVNKGFVTPRHDTVTVDLNFDFRVGDEVTVTYPGGIDVVVVEEDMETRPEIWKELATAKQFEEKVEEIKMSGLGFKAAAEALRSFSSVSEPVNRSLSERTNAVFRSLSTAPDPPAIKRAAVEIGFTRGCVQKSADAGTFESLVDEGSPVFRSLGCMPDDDDEGAQYRSLPGCAVGDQVTFEAKTGGSELQWAALASQARF